MRTQMKKQQSGFTLIELVMVIVILGILAAFALPRFANLSSEARLASLNGALGSVKAASAIAHAKFLVAPATATIEGTAVTFVNGYPDYLTISGLAQAADFAPDTSTATEVTFTSGLCEFVYHDAAANAAPVIDAITGGPNC